ncbi:nucleolar protein 12-like [Mya arenaria]|uniref:nucleolar protein 12-like n=1 Tax=Mya arenaria TaxID=6604 RepID=UPI0022E59BA5|nr:nucleolar protein 12-like [Mya arenaria]XP_052818233.1 nucleolar protein 12-like [Mya arenaria]
MGFDKKKKKLRKKNRQTKSTIVFDEKARKDYLTGFRKRKDERRKKAQEQVQRMIKEDRKLLKQKMKEFETVKTRYQQLPTDLELIAERQVTELPNHTVTITDISDIDLAGHAGTRLGLNQVLDSGSEHNDSEPEEEKPVSLNKHDKALKSIKTKIFKTSKHVKKKSQKKTTKTLSKKERHKKTFQN